MKKKKRKKKKKKEKNNILFPKVKKNIEIQMSEMFENDRPKSME